MTRKTHHNSTYPKVAVQWLNQALCIYQSFCLADSEVLRNRHLRVAAKRYKLVAENFFCEKFSAHWSLLIGINN